MIGMEAFLNRITKMVRFGEKGFISNMALFFVKRISSKNVSIEVIKYHQTLLPHLPF